MTLPIHVDAYSGYKANERPLRFWLNAYLDGDKLTGIFEIEAVEDRWYEPNAEYFRVLTKEGKRYTLRYNEQDNFWTLQNAFDGAELF